MAKIINKGGTVNEAEYEKFKAETIQEYSEEIHRLELVINDKDGDIDELKGLIGELISYDATTELLTFRKNLKDRIEQVLNPRKDKIMAKGTGKKGECGGTPRVGKKGDKKPVRGRGRRK